MGVNWSRKDERRNRKRQTMYEECERGRIQRNMTDRMTYSLIPGDVKYQKAADLNLE